MLCKDIEETHGACSESLEKTKNIPNNTFLIDNEIDSGEIDPYVQKMISATNGTMWKSLITKLKNYPIPKLPLLPLISGENKYFLD